MRNIVTLLILLSWIFCVAGCEKDIKEVKAPAEYREREKGAA